MVAVTTSRPRRRLARPGHLTVVVPPAGASRVPTTFGARAIDTAVPARERRLRTDAVPRASAATYRRRRLAAVVVAAGLAFAAWSGLGALGGVLTAPVRSAPPPGGGVTVVEVAPGDTLWSIARRLQPEGDPRPLVDRLAASHGGVAIHPGDRLMVG